MDCIRPSQKFVSKWEAIERSSWPVLLQVQLKEINCGTLNQIFPDDLPLPIRIVEAGAGADFSIKYALKQPEDALEQPEAVTAACTNALAESLGLKTLLGNFKALGTSACCPPEGCCSLNIDGPKSCPVPAGAWTMTNLTHWVDCQLQVDRPVQVQKTSQARMRSSDTELVA